MQLTAGQASHLVLQQHRDRCSLQSCRSCSSQLQGQSIFFFLDDCIKAQSSVDIDSWLPLLVLGNVVVSNAQSELGRAAGNMKGLLVSRNQLEKSSPCLHCHHDPVQRQHKRGIVISDFAYLAVQALRSQEAFCPKMLLHSGLRDYRLTSSQDEIVKVLCRGGHGSNTMTTRVIKLVCAQPQFCDEALLAIAAVLQHCLQCTGYT